MTELIPKDTAAADADTSSGQTTPTTLRPFNVVTDGIHGPYLLLTRVDVPDDAGQFQAWRCVNPRTERVEFQQFRTDAVRQVNPIEIPELLAGVLIREADARKDAERRLRDAAEELVTFKVSVRDLAIETAHDQDWCTSGLNDALEQLGLDTYEPTQEVTVTITATVIGDTHHEARDALIATIESALDDDSDVETFDTN